MSAQDSAGESGHGGAEQSMDRTIEELTVGDVAEIDPELPITRRGAMRAGAAAGVAAIGVGASAGGAAAQTAGLNFSSDFVHDPWIDADVTIGEHDRSSDGRAMSSQFQYINDNGEVADLRDMGARVRPQDEDDAENDVPFNPVTLRADRIDADTFSAMPRSEDFDESGDGDEDTDVTALDSTHWSGSDSASGTISIADADSAAGGPALQISTDGVADGETATASLDDSSSEWEFLIESGLGRKYLQVGMNIATLDGVVEVAVGDGTNFVTTVADTAADETADATIATSTGDGKFHQVQLGELSGIDDLGEISELEVRVEDADADVTLYALDVERESRLSFGSREYTNSDDELDTETVRSPDGEYSITGLDTLGSAFDGATIVDLGISTRFEASGLPAENIDADWQDAERYDQDHRLRKAITFDLPTAYDLSYADLSAKDEVKFPGSRYIEIAFEDDAGEEPATVSEWDDDDLTLTSRTSTYSDASIDDTVTLTTSVTTDSTFVVVYDYLLSDDERDDATATAAVGAAGATSDGGLMGWFSGVRGIASAVAVGALGYIALIRRRAGV